MCPKLHIMEPFPEKSTQITTGTADIFQLFQRLCKYLFVKKGGRFCWVERGCWALLLWWVGRGCWALLLLWWVMGIWESASCQAFVWSLADSSPRGNAEKAKMQKRIIWSFRVHSRPPSDGLYFDDMVTLPKLNVMCKPTISCRFIAFRVLSCLVYS